MSVLVSQGCHNKELQTGWLRTDRNIAYFWRLESEIKVFAGPAFL